MSTHKPRTHGPYGTPRASYIIERISQSGILTKLYKLTALDRDVLNCISNHIRAQRCCRISTSTLMDFCQISKRTVHRTVNKLSSKQIILTEKSLGSINTFSLHPNIRRIFDLIQLGDISSYCKPGELKINCLEEIFYPDRLSTTGATSDTSERKSYPQPVPNNHRPVPPVTPTSAKRDIHSFKEEHIRTIKNKDFASPVSDQNECIAVSAESIVGNVVQLFAGKKQAAEEADLERGVYILPIGGPSLPVRKIIGGQYKKRADAIFSQNPNSEFESLYSKISENFDYSVFWQAQTNLFRIRVLAAPFPDTANHAFGEEEFKVCLFKIIREMKKINQQRGRDDEFAPG